MNQIDLQIETLKNKNIVSIRSFIGEKLSENMKKRGITQEVLGEKIGKSHPYVNQVIKGKTGTSKVYIDLFYIIGMTSQEILDVYKEAFKKENELIFGDIGMKTLIIDDHGQEPVTTKEEAEKVLFKANGIRPTESAIRSVRFAIDLIKKEQENECKKDL